MTTGAVILVLAAFLASAVEAVEALTVVLAVGVTRGWRSSLIGAGTATLALAAMIAALGPALSLIPIDVLRLIVGTLLLIFGLQWLRKAILRAGHYKAFRDEEALYRKELADARAAGRTSRTGMDWYAFTLAFKAVFLEGLEVAFIVLTFGTSQGSIPLAALGAGIAILVVVAVGALVHQPLSRVPENTMKFAVGLMLAAFGIFWSVEGVGIAWPGADVATMYSALARSAPTETDLAMITDVQRDEETHSRLASSAGATPNVPIGPQQRLDSILHRERWHRHSGGWIGQAIYGANDGLGSVFGIVTGVAGATAGAPAVLIAGLAGMLASALSMGSGAYLATKADREVQEAEIARERREVEQNPAEEEEELSLFYQLKGVPEEEARTLAARLIAQPEHALATLASEELGLSGQTYPNPWTAALSATLSTASGAFIPIIPFFFTSGYPAIIASFAISTLAHFLIGAAKTVVTGLSPWRSGAEMTVVGLGEALITYLLGLVFGGVVG